MSEQKFWLNKIPLIGTISEMIGRTDSFDIQENNWRDDLFESPTVDLSRPIYALNMAIYKASIVKDRDGKTYGEKYTYGAIFGKPIINSCAAFAFAGLKAPRVGVEDENGDLINNFLYRERKRLYDMLRFGSRDGDNFVRVNYNEGDVYLEFIDPNIIDVVTDEENINVVIGYDLTHVFYENPKVKTGKKVIKEEYRNQNPYYTKKVLDEKGKVVEIEENNEFEFLPIVHFANEKDTGSIYGVSDYQNLYELMKAYNVIMQNAIKGTVYNSQPTPIITGIKKFGSLLSSNFKKKSTAKSDDGVSDYSIKWKPNKMVLLGDGQDMKMLNIPDHVTPATKMLEYLFYCIVQASETPEWVMGTAVASSKASVSEQVAVMVNKAYRKRADIEEPIYEIIDIFLQYMINTGEIKGSSIENIDISLEWPPIVEEDQTLNLELIKVLKELGLITDETALQLSSIKIDDIEGEIEKARSQTIDRNVAEMRMNDIYSPFSAHQYDKKKDIKKEVDKDEYKSKRKLKK